MKNKAIIGIILICVVVLAILMGANGSFGGTSSGNRADSTSPVKIGLSLPLTGGAGFLGESARNAALLALKDANADAKAEAKTSAKGGKLKYNYELVFEDDAFNPAKTATVANKFVNVDKVLAMITFGSATSNAAAPITESAGVPRFGLASDPTSAKGEFNYIHWTPPFKEGKLMADEIIKRGYKRVAIVDTNHSGTRAVSESVRKALADAGVTPVADEMTNVGDKDFKTIITKLKNANPDIVSVQMFSPEIEIFTKQARAMGLKADLTAVETFEWSNEINLFEGLWFISDAHLPEKFVQEFTTEYGKNPSAGSAYIYDLVSMIIKQQESSNKRLSPADLNNLITKVGSYDSKAFEKKVMIDKDGFFITDASVKMIKDGKAVFAD